MCHWVALKHIVGLEDNFYHLPYQQGSLNCMVELKVNNVFFKYDYKVIPCNFKSFILWELNVEIVILHMLWFITQMQIVNLSSPMELIKILFSRWCVNIESLVMDLDLLVVGFDLPFEAQYHWMLLLKWCLNLIVEVFLANHSLFISFMDDISSFQCEKHLLNVGWHGKKQFFEVACGVAYSL